MKMRIFVFGGCPVHAGGPEAEALHVKVYDTQYTASDGACPKEGAEMLLPPTLPKKHPSGATPGAGSDDGRQLAGANGGGGGGGV